MPRMSFWRALAFGLALNFAVIALIVNDDIWHPAIACAFLMAGLMNWNSE